MLGTLSILCVFFFFNHLLFVCRGSTRMKDMDNIKTVKEEW